jgi:integrase
MLETRYFKRTLNEGYLQTISEPVNLQITDAAMPGLQVRYSAKTGRKVFYLWYRVKGTGQQRNMRLGSTDEFSLIDARTLAIKLRKDVSGGLDPQVVQREHAKEALVKEQRRKKVKELTLAFLEQHTKENNRHSTYLAHESLVRIHINPMIGEKIIDEIDLAFVQDFYDRLKNMKSIACADHVRRILSTFLNWCERHNYRALGSNPCRLITKAKAPKFKHTLLDVDGYRKLLAALDEALGVGTYSRQALLALKALALTGCRSGEIKELEKDEMDLENGYLHLNKRKTDSFDVPLGEPAIAVIRQALKICKSKRYVFHSSIDHTRPISDLRTPFRWALERAGLPEMRVHDLRHSFATLATGIGEDIRVLKDVLGHTKITTTEIYAHTTGKAALRTANNVATAIVSGKE